MPTLLHAKKKDGTFERERKLAKATFLTTFADGHSVNFSAIASGVQRDTPYAWAEEDPQFKYDWEQAKEARGDWYEDQLRDQAERGVPVSTIVGLKMHKRFIEERGAPFIGGDLHITITQVTNQLALIIDEVDARFPGVAAFMEEKLKALQTGQK